MEAVFSLPEWFFGIGLLLELFFFLITLLICMYAFQILRLSGKKEIRHVAFGFLYLSFSYIIQLAINFFIYLKYQIGLFNFVEINLSLLNSVGVYFFMIFFMLGLLKLLYMTFKVDKQQIYYLFAILVIIAITFAKNWIFIFNILASVILVYIIYYFFIKYLDNKNSKVLPMLIFLVFLLFGKVPYFISMHHPLTDVIYNLLTFIGYIFLLAILIMVVKNGCKKK